MAHCALLTFCFNPERDRVAPLAYSTAKQLLALQPTGMMVDEQEVLHHTTAAGDNIYIVGTREVMPHDYPRYLPMLANLFPAAECVLVVNWHEGADAPDKVITFHTNGDIPSGNFAGVAPRQVRAVLLAAERWRKELKLDDYRVLTEATHWSGRMEGQDPSQIERWSVPVYDFEVGSSPAAWGNLTAAEVLVRAALHVFDPQPPFSTLLCVGGLHFQEDYCRAVLADHAEARLSLGHIIHTKWMETAEYLEEEGRRRFEHCIASIQGEVQGIVFHDSIRGPYKALLRELGAGFKIPVLQHRRLRSLGADLLRMPV
jgi:D-tyrosyl-tRNA(Tyr) deacylase